MRRLRSLMLRSGFFAVVTTALLGALPGPERAAAAPLGARTGAASESRLVSQTALGTLKRGGTAVDAVIAAALAAGVVAPSSSGLGGGGVAIVYRALDHSVTVLDFRETAPAVLDVGAFERRPLAEAEQGKLVGVPGEMRGLGELHRRFGKLSWAELVAPAERFARDGFAVETHLASIIGGKDQKRYRRVLSLERAFWPRGTASLVGQRAKRPELAGTLHTLGAAGPEALYGGAIAADLVSAAQKLGGTLSKGDIEHYAVRERQPLRISWEGYEIVTMPPPSAGGLFLAEVLGSFTKQELLGLGFRTPLGMHLLAETMRGALADRARFVGDPEILPIDLARLLEPGRLRARKARVLPERTQSVRGIAGEDHGTHALVVADAAGNVVSLTTTVNTAFGAELAGEASGIVLNDELDDFTAQSASSEVGVRFPPNLARPGRRPASSMMPTLVFRDGKPVLALGGSGGYAIPPSVTETLLGLLVHGEAPEVAVKSPRFRFDSKDYALLLDGAFSDAVREDLVRRGETLRMSESTSAVQVLSFTAAGIVGAADPRKGGAALVQ